MEISNKDPGKFHFYVSIVKSVVRIAAGISLVVAGYSMMHVWVILGGALLIVAEILGVVEEL